MDDVEYDQTYELLKSYTQEYKEIVTQVKQDLEILQTAIGDEKQNIIQKIQNYLDKAEDNIQTMTMSVQGESITPKQKKKVTKRIAKFEQQLDILRKDFKIAKYKANQNERKALLEDDQNESDDDLEAGEAEKQSLLRSQKVLEQSGESIDRSLRIAHELEEMGTSTLLELNKQKGIIRSATDKLGVVGTEIRRSARLINRMLCTQLENKIIIWALIIVLIILIVLIIYFGIIRPILPESWRLL